MHRQPFQMNLSRLFVCSGRSLIAVAALSGRSRSRARCQPCKTAMRSVVGARCCGGLHPDANDASKVSFWKQVQDNTVHGMNLSQAMTQRYARVYKEAPELTGDCLRDVLEMGKPISFSQGSALLACASNGVGCAPWNSPAA